MASQTTAKPTFSTARRLGIWLNVFLSTVAFLALVVMANYLASGYYKRFEIASNSRVELAPQTIKVLQSLTNDVEATIFFDTTEDEDIYSQVATLLKEYHYINPRLKVRTLDFMRFPGDAALFLSKYKLAGLERKNFVLFDSNGLTRTIYQNQLSDYDINAVLRGETKEFRRTGFKGEMLFTAAIFSVIHPRPLKAYFLTGHGEHDPDNSTQDYGYGKFAAVLKDENNVDWEKLSLTGTNGVPADCQLLIITGPSKAQFAENELTAIQNYLSRGNRMLVALNNLTLGGRSGVESVLTDWGLQVDDDIVLDPDNRASTSGADLLTKQLDPSHDVTKTMFKEGLAVQMVLPRSMRPTAVARKSTDTPDIKIIAATGTNATAKLPLVQGGETTYREVHGAFGLMAAIERGSIKGVSAERGASRILVVGDSLFWSNHLLDSAANHYFAGFAVNWLLAQPSILLEGLSARPVREYNLNVSAARLETVRWTLLAIVPGTIVAFGTLVWLRRRS